jgi:hypothetical protein
MDSYPCPKQVARGFTYLFEVPHVVAPIACTLLGQHAVLLEGLL